MVYVVYDDDASDYAVKILSLFTTAYTNKIELNVSGMNVIIQYDGAGIGTDTLYWQLLRLL